MLLAAIGKAFGNLMLLRAMLPCWVISCNCTSQGGERQRERARETHFVQCPTQIWPGRAHHRPRLCAGGSPLCLSPWPVSFWLDGRVWRKVGNLTSWESVQEIEGRAPQYSALLPLSGATGGWCAVVNLSPSRACRYKCWRFGERARPSSEGGEKHASTHEGQAEPCVGTEATR